MGQAVVSQRALQKVGACSEGLSEPDGTWELLGCSTQSFKSETPGSERMLVQFSGVAQEKIKPHHL